MEFTDILVVKTEKRGRIFVANRDFSAGEIVCVQDKPVASVLQAQHVASYCHFCWVQSDNLLRCSKCIYARYCSQDCRKNHWKSHCKECEAMADFQKLHSRQPPAQVILMSRCLRAKLYPLNVNAANGSDYAALLQCVSNYEFQTSENKETFAQTSMLVKDLIGNGDWNKLISLSDEGSLFREISHNFSRFYCNNWTIYNGELIPLGGGVYPRVSLLNHSCTPSCCVSFVFGQEPIANVRALRNIAKGEELTLSYVDTSLTTMGRMDLLRTGYFFDCSCERCLNSKDSLSKEAERDRILTASRCCKSYCSKKERILNLEEIKNNINEKSFSLLCLESAALQERVKVQNAVKDNNSKEFCSGYLIQLESTNPALGSISPLQSLSKVESDSKQYLYDVEPELDEFCTVIHVCSRCFRIETLPESRLRTDSINSSNILYKQAIVERDNRSSGACSLLEKCIVLQREVLYPFNIDMSSSINAISMHLIDLGKIEEAEKWVIEGLRWYEWVYPSNSPVLGLHFLILGRIFWRLEKPTLCIPLFEKGISILKVSHGISHSIVKEAISTLKEAEDECRYMYSLINK